MEKLSLVLVIIGLSVFVFSLWSLLLIKRHLRKNKSYDNKTINLSDEKYFELKSRQEYIISISAIVFSIISFIGYTSIDNIKSDISRRLKDEVAILDSLNKKAHDNYFHLEVRGKTYEDSVRSAFKVLSSLNNQMKQLFRKDVITQNIFIVDPLRIGDYPKDSTDQYDEGYRVVQFRDLLTINGRPLPAFKEPPSIICIASSIGTVKIKEIRRNDFIVQLESYLPKNSKDKGEDVTFTAWISQKPENRSFNEDFSDDFK